MTHEFLRKIIRHAKGLGYRLLIRDNSHLGFPSYQVVIPGLHDGYPVTRTRIRECCTRMRCVRIMNHFPALTEEEERILLLYLRFNK